MTILVQYEPNGLNKTLWHKGGENESVFSMQSDFKGEKFDMCIF